MLYDLEKNNINQLSLWNIWNEISKEVVIKEVFRKSKLEEKLENIDINLLTPIEALNLLHNYKK
jgi:DNA mismatch repair ATPase MutS